MATPRSIRIPRRPVAAPRIAPAPGDERFVPNAAGTARAVRLFVAFLALLLVIYLLFVGLALSTRGASPAGNAIAWGIFSAFAAGFAISGWTITLGRAPRGFWRRSGELAVKERLGRVRRFPANGVPKVAKRFGAGPLGPEPTIFVELTGTDGAKRTYLVGEGTIERSPA